MNISEFTDQEFVDVIKLNNASYKSRSGENLKPIVIHDIKRTDSFVLVSATQLFMEKYLLKKIFRFSNKNDLTIKAEMLEDTFSKDGWLDYSAYYTPLFRMISKNEQHKGDDWLSRFSKDVLYYFANKYIFPCADISIEARDYSNHHCKDIFFKDNQDYVFQATCFGDYGIHYAKHFCTLSKLNKPQIFCTADIEFYHLMITKLNPEDRIRYTNNFIEAHSQAFIKQHPNNPNFQQELKNGRIIAQNLINAINNEHNLMQIDI